VHLMLTTKIILQYMNELVLKVAGAKVTDYRNAE
jgi:hypothetical protein